MEKNIRTKNFSIILNTKILYLPVTNADHFNDLFVSWRSLCGKCKRKNYFAPQNIHARKHTTTHTPAAGASCQNALCVRFESSNGLKSSTSCAPNRIFCSDKTADSLHHFWLRSASLLFFVCRFYSPFSLDGFRKRLCVRLMRSKLKPFVCSLLRCYCLLNTLDLCTAQAMDGAYLWFCHAKIHNHQIAFVITMFLWRLK